jgi:hypothetical protein
MTDPDASNQIIRDQAEQIRRLRAELEAARAAPAASQTRQVPPPGPAPLPAPPPSPSWRDDAWLRHVPLMVGLLVAALVAGLIVLLTGSLF